MNLVLSVVLAIICLGDGVAANAQVEPIQLNMELWTDAPRYLVGENFVLHLRLQNPNTFSVVLRSSGMLSEEVVLELRLPETESYVRLPSGAHESGGPKRTVTLGPRETLEDSRFFYRDFGRDQWNMPPGEYVLRATPTIDASQPRANRQGRPVDWGTATVTFTLEQPGAREAMALECLNKAQSDYDDARHRDGVSFNNQDFLIRIRKRFLVRFPESRYAPEIRFKLANSLLSKIDNADRNGQLQDEDSLRLLDDCLAFCVERGGLYAKPFLTWDMDRGGNQVLNYSLRFGRDALLRRITAALVAAYPEEKDAALYRRALVAESEDSVDDLQRAADSLSSAFPESRYTPLVLKMRQVSP